MFWVLVLFFVGFPFWFGLVFLLVGFFEDGDSLLKFSHVFICIAENFYFSELPCQPLSAYYVSNTLPKGWDVLVNQQTKIAALMSMYANWGDKL